MSTVYSQSDSGGSQGGMSGGQPPINPSPAPSAPPPSSAQSQGQPPASGSPANQPIQGQPAFGQPGVNPSAPSGQPGMPPLSQQPPAPVAPDYGAKINGWGGEERVGQALGFWDLYASPQFAADKLLDTIHGQSPERYNAIVKDVFNTHGQEMRGEIVKQALADPQQKASILQALGWNDGDYQQYRAFLEQNGGRINIDPKQQQMQQQLEQLQAERNQQEQAQTHYQRQAEFGQFTGRLAQPVNEFINKLNLPQNATGQIAATLMASGAQAAFGNSPENMKLWQETEALFMRGESALAAGAYTRLATAIEAAARPVFEQVGRWMAAEAELATLKQQVGQAQPPISQPNAIGGGMFPREQQPQQNAQPPFAVQGLPGYGPFGADNMKAELAQLRAARQGQR